MPHKGCNAKPIECEGSQDQDGRVIAVITITCVIPYRKLSTYTLHSSTFGRCKNAF